MTDQEKNNKRSLYTTIGVHILLLGLFFITLAWTEPDPPIPEYGIEFSLGESLVQESETTEPLVAEEINEVEEVAEQEETLESTNASASNPSNDPIDEPVESQEQELNEAVTEDINSPDLVEEVEEVVIPEEVVQTVEENGTGEEVEPIVEENIEEEQNETIEEKKEEVVEPEIDDRAIFKKTENSIAGGNKGASLDMSGWEWDFKPKPNDTSEENGMIVFQITVDEEGEILNVTTLEKTISPVLEKVYREAVMELTLSPTAGNRSVAAQSTGSITFIIQSK